MSAPVTDAALGQSALFCGLFSLSFARRTIDVPSIFLGQERLGRLSATGAVDRLQDTACTRFVGCRLLGRRRALVQQEQATRVSELWLDLGRGHSHQLVLGETRMRTNFDARGVNYAPIEMTSYPPKRRLSFALDDIRYVIVVTLTREGKITPLK